jgi:predicted dehydrogenase
VIPHHHTFKLYGTERTFIQDYNKTYVSKSREVSNKVFKINNNYLDKNKKKILESFIHSLVSKKKPIVSQSDVINSMAISLAIDKSVKSNKWEKIKY